MKTMDCIGQLLATVGIVVFFAGIFIIMGRDIGWPNAIKCAAMITIMALLFIGFSLSVK